MCGIIGFLGIGGGSCKSAQVENAVHALAHRGPDGEGIVAWDVQGHRHQGGEKDSEYVVGLGHRRLAILDLSAAGSQPMVSPQGNWIVFNGEIYNYIEVRDELKKFGHQFVSTSDTEVILAAYAQWGRDCARRFNGMWAFAIYDVARRGVFWSRDRLGVKPFFYTRSENAICFASEITALHCLLCKRPAIDRAQLAKFVVWGIGDDGGETIWKGVRELSPGHCAWIELDAGAFDSWQFWEFPQDADLELTDEEAVDEFAELLEDSVKIRLRSDVPLAITLSGGTDSSAVAVAASRIGATAITTITSSFPGNKEIDETRYACEVAKICGLESILVEPKMKRLIEDEPRLTRHQEAPYGSLSLYVHWALIENIKALGIPVVLSGQGGDELFLGYERYYTAHCLAQFPNLFGMAKSMFHASCNSRLGFATMAMQLAYFGNRRVRRFRMVSRARCTYNPALLEAAPGLPPYVALSLRSLQRQEICGEQLRHLLRYDDRTTAAHGMETRLPFLDYRLVEFACRLPWSHKIRHGWTKYLVRRYLQRHLPSSVAWRKSKLGFNAPDVEWTRHLVQCRGERLMASPFRCSLLRPELRRFPQIPRPQWWNVYHILHLADMLHWEADWT
ncbi:MAG: asparagine synthase (glutamine-hydrolyzing) [Tepidisphaeraceae bacterium]|jgi:asparagine synthase (glutamine-hydrolysing)